MITTKQIEEIAKSSGTKLYKHALFESSMDYKLTLITTNPQPIDFSSIDTYQKLNDYLMSQNVIRFTDEVGNNVLYDDSFQNAFYTIYLATIQDNRICAPSYYDDWTLSNTTDTVTEL